MSIYPITLQRLPVYLGDKMTLKERIQRELTSYSGEMSFYARDFSGNTVSIDEDQALETASVIKSYILLDLFEQVAKGKKNLEEEILYEERFRVEGSGVLHNMSSGFKMSARNYAILMIIISDNTATNVMIDYLGLESINSTIKKYGFVKTKLLNPIDWESYRDLGVTTAKEYGDFFYRLHEGELVSAAASKQMLEIFKKQHYNSMIARNFPQYFLSGDDSLCEEGSQITVASKSGSMDACRNDGGIVFTPVGDYVLVMLHKGFHDPLYYADHDASFYGARVSRMVLDQFLALEGRLLK